MEPTDEVFDAMLNLINKYLHETWGVGLYSDELLNVIDHLRGDRKVPAIKYVREATKRSEKELFKLDLTSREGAPISDFTAWATTNNIRLATGKVDVQYLDLKKAKDFVEFIQLNLDNIAG